MIRAWGLVALAAAVAAACSDPPIPVSPTREPDTLAGNRPDRVSPTREPDTAGADRGADRVSPTRGPDRPALADWPRMELAANHPRVQGYDRGLVIVVGGEGLRQYDLEYKRQFGDVVTVDGVAARALRSKAATLTAPYAGGAGTIEVRVHGAVKSIKLAIDGKAAGTIARGADGLAVGALPELAAGEHRFTLTPDKKKAVISSVELIGAAPPPAEPCAAPFPVAPVADGALGGYREIRIPIEIPRAGHLAITPAGGGPASIAAHRDGADHAVLWSGVADGSAQLIDLAAYADHVIELRLHGSCATRWQGAAIAVAARPVAPPPPPVKNLILVVVDTLRADRLAAMGPTRVQTPRLTEAAARGVAFQRHQAMAPSSPPSHATIHTGQIPRVHGVAGDDPPLATGAPVIARIAGDAGFYTGYIGNNDFAMGRLRQAAGWDDASTPALDGRGNECPVVMAGVLDMVKTARAAGKRYFISALPIQPHAPYRYHAGVTEKYFPGPFVAPIGKRVTSAHMARVKARGLSPAQWDQYRGLYDGEVELVDTCFGLLVDGLAALGASDDTAIIVTSDHGEGMGERGKNSGHAYGLFHELLSVPLIVVAPGLAPSTVDTVTAAMDVAPTVLDLLGLPPDPRIQGASLVPLARFGAGAPRRVVPSEYGIAHAMRGGRWRYVTGYDGRGHLFDVVADPDEKHDVALANPIALRYLRGAAGLYLAHRTAWRSATWGTLGDLAPTSPLAPP